MKSLLICLYIVPPPPPPLLLLSNAVVLTLLLLSPQIINLENMSFVVDRVVGGAFRKCCFDHYSSLYKGPNFAITILPVTKLRFVPLNIKKISTLDLVWRLWQYHLVDSWQMAHHPPYHPHKIPSFGTYHQRYFLLKLTKYLVLWQKAAPCCC